MLPEETKAPSKNYSIKIDDKSIDATDILDKSSANALLKFVKKQNSDKIKRDLAFCQLLWLTKNTIVEYKEGGETYEIAFYEYCDYSSWNDFVLNELQITPKTARGYVSVWDKFGIELGHKFDPEKHSLHISKLMLLARVATEQNFASLIRGAQKITERQLRAMTRGKLSKTKKFVNYSYSRREDKWRKEAFALAEQIFGAEEELMEGELFIKIMQSFVDSNAGQRKLKLAS